ncbi:MAG: FtsQ-type POTRA domain-containing protein [Clostridia bacterium]|nr:FtsQ-type POTRA domain-containing protein [Clostridia bacterium]
MFTSRSFAKKFGQGSTSQGRGYTPLWPWKACFYTILGLGIALVVSALLLILANAWKVDTVKVEGAEKFSADALLYAAGISADDSMMSFGERGVTEKLQAVHPLIRDVRIKRSLNGTVTLQVSEEETVYYTCLRSNYYLISAEDLKVMGVASEGDLFKSYGAMYIGFPEEARLTVGKKVEFAYLPYEPVSAPEEVATYEVETEEADEEFAYVWDFVNTVCDSSLSGHITGMELSDRYDLYLVYDGYIRIRFGNTQDMDRKLRLAEDILQKENDGEKIPAEMDVSATKGTYREIPDLSLPAWAMP